LAGIMKLQRNGNREWNCRERELLL